MRDQEAGKTRKRSWPEELSPRTGGYVEFYWSSSGQQQQRCVIWLRQPCGDFLSAADPDQPENALSPVSSCDLERTEGFWHNLKHWQARGDSEFISLPIDLSVFWLYLHCLISSSAPLPQRFLPLHPLCLLTMAVLQVIGVYTSQLPLTKPIADVH